MDKISIRCLKCVPSTLNYSNRPVPHQAFLSLQNCNTKMESLMHQHMKPGVPTDALPQLPSLIPQTNKLRQRNHPPNPTTLDFTVINDVITPGFLQEDIKTQAVATLSFIHNINCSY